MHMTRFRAIAPMYAVSALMGLVISALVTWVQLGPVPEFFDHWWRAAALSIAVMLPSGGLVVLGVSFLVKRALADRPVWLQRSAMALGMGMAMEAVASALSTINNLGTQDFVVHWAHAYWRAIPLVFVMGPFMAFVIRPWIERRLARVAPTAGAAA
jgi:Protein of unknown function (DUF2798)